MMDLTESDLAAYLAHRDSGFSATSTPAMGRVQRPSADRTNAMEELMEFCSLQERMGGAAMDRTSKEPAVQPVASAKDRLEAAISAPEPEITRPRETALIFHQQGDPSIAAQHKIQRAYMEISKIIHQYTPIDMTQSGPSAGRVGSDLGPA